MSTGELMRKNDGERYSSVADSMVASRIREVMELAWKDPNTIHLEVGEPDFPSPPHVIEAAHAAALAGRTRYTPNAGLPELREALTEKIRSRNGYWVIPEHVIVTQGGVEALYSVLLSLLDPGEEVLLPEPSWPDFRMMAHLLGARVVAYPLVARHGFLPQREDLERLVSPRTRAILINTPSNPLGAVISYSIMQDLLDFARRHGLWLISDEVYDEIVFDESFVSAGAVAEREDRLVSIYSFSKVYAMTGWRVGYAVVPPRLAPILTKVQEPIISCVNTPAQMAALSAVTGPQEAVASMRDAYRVRRDRLLRALESEGLHAVRPSGAFYVWVDVSVPGVSSMELAHRLVSSERLAVAPGSAFGKLGEGYVRLSLASALDDLLEGARRLGRAVKRMRREQGSAMNRSADT